ncbi:hypothetical protein GCM10007897_02430 [Sphingobium jiangsuense]|uniref:Acyl-CoA dehydrogenase/oxidase C-terminal domain-containing protein n=1 Tax=Sphingobium jiangsuense TaxID=870476 RepID=A0A7W6BNI7_9SPHN|nr:acyl-CoA dehydrogenase family protein [Sphingobium jiangsuense]MBB3926857.1 hypothetical protein [Sphingobium jiangsuense]GLS98865.1 hypothetical protein GCM10007897_02430 [Sphingobium jiangsuense]
MEDISQVVFDSARRLLGELADGMTPGAPLSDRQRADGWNRIEEMGLPLALMDEDKGGFGLPLADAFELVKICGRHITGFPLVETMLAHRFAAASGKPAPDGPVEAPGELQTAQRDYAALARSAQMTGALDAILALTIAHVSERRQFGRPLSAFQAVQHSLAVLASEVAAAHAAADHATGVLAQQGEGDAFTLAVGIARTRIGEACSKATSLGHQLHGAMGYAREHRLHLYTTALWRWRDEFGTQLFWSREVGQRVLAAGRDRFWLMVTAA